MARPSKQGGKTGSGKGPPPGTQNNLHKRIESEQVSAHIDAFEKSGGRVEKLGVTRVLQRISAPPAAPAPSGKSRKR